MHGFTEDFIKYCESNFHFDNEQTIKYQSLPICIVDCVYSLRTQYYRVTVPIVERYAAYYLNGDKFSADDTISRFVSNLERDGLHFFADDVVKNHQFLGGVPKAEVCYRLAQYLECLNIETIEDFQNFKSQELLNIVICAVKGIGDAGANYLFMLAGDENRCKPDVHIHHCIADACGSDVSNEECQIIFTEAVKKLRKQYPYLTVRKLDGVVWKEYQRRNAQRIK